MTTTFCSYCTVHPGISKVFQNANELSVHPFGCLSATVCMLQMKKERHKRVCSHCVTQWHSILGEAALCSQHTPDSDIM